MKKHFLFLLTLFLLAFPFTVNADSLGNGTLHVAWSSPTYAGYYLDYDGTVTDSPTDRIDEKFYEDIFCVSHDDANSTEYVEFFTIDPTLASFIGVDNYVKISKAAYIADNWYTYTGYSAMDAQVAIWSVTGVVPVIASSSSYYANATYLVGLTDDITEYSTDTYALAISGGYASGTGGSDYQDYLVPMNPVPEPATMFLLGAGLVGLGGFGRKRFMK